MIQKIKVPVADTGVDVRTIANGTEGGVVQSSYAPTFVELVSGTSTGNVTEDVLDIPVQDFNGIVIEIAITSGDSGMVNILGQLFNSDELFVGEISGKYAIGGNYNVNTNVGFIDSASVTKSVTTMGGGFCLFPLSSSQMQVPFDKLDLRMEFIGDYYQSSTWGDVSYKIYGVINGDIKDRQYVPFSFESTALMYDEEFHPVTGIIIRTSA